MSDLTIKDKNTLKEFLSLPAEKESELSEVLTVLNIFVASMEQATNRRIATHSLFAVLNAGATAVYAQTLDSLCSSQCSVLGLLSLLFIVVNFIWFKTTESHRSVAQSKREIIKEIETHLPIKPFTAQYELVQRWNGAGLSTSELFVPVLLCLVHMGFFVGFLFRKCCP